MYSVWNMECGIGMWAGLTDVTDAGVFPSAGSILQVNLLPTNSPNMFVS